MSRYITAAAALFVLAACNPILQPRAQLAVWISADSELSERLVALKVDLYRDGETDSAHATVSHTFALAQTPAGTPRLRFSFGLSDQGPGTFTLVARGCSDSAQCGRFVIEHKVKVRFEAKRILQLHLQLSHACAGASELCPQLNQSCRPDINDAEQVECVSVPWAATEVISGTDGRAPELAEEPSALEPSQTMTEVEGGAPAAGEGGARDAGRTGAQDSGTTTSRAGAEATVPEDAGTKATTIEECPADQSCLEPYQCIANPGGDVGYFCQGRFASWHMPDALPGARWAPSYDAQSSAGVVHDEVTGLAWQQFAPEIYAGCTRGLDKLGDSCTWLEGRDYCRNLTLAGLSWRLPTFIELASLLDYRSFAVALSAAAKRPITPLPSVDSG
jgi:hypothetical protein